MGIEIVEGHGDEGLDGGGYGPLTGAWSLELGGMVCWARSELLEQNQELSVVID